MSKPNKPSAELLVIIGAVVILVAGLVIVPAARGDSSDDRAVGQPVATVAETVTSTPTVVPSTASVTVTDPPTATATVFDPPVATVTVPPGALLQSAEQAIAAGLEYANWLGAEHPRLVKIELMTLGEAMKLRSSGSDEATDDGAEALGWDLSSAAWRVQFDNDEFFHESCEPPVEDPEATATPGPYICPTSPTAIFIFRASDGGAITIALGDPVSQ